MDCFLAVAPRNDKERAAHISQRRHCERSEAIQLCRSKKEWIASSRSLSSGAHSRDPLAPRNDAAGDAHLITCDVEAALLPKIILLVEVIADLHQHRDAFGIAGHCDRGLFRLGWSPVANSLVRVRRSTAVRSLPPQSSSR